jgi:hypothetical protein
MRKRPNSPSPRAIRCQAVVRERAGITLIGGVSRGFRIRAPSNAILDLASSSVRARVVVVTDRTFGQIIALLGEHEQTRDLHATVINDDFIALVCQRLAQLPIPPVSPGEVERAWQRQTDSFPGPPTGSFGSSE